MRYAGNTAVAKYRADCRLINRYHGNKKVAGWKEQEQSGVILSFEDTYNDVFQSVRVHGTTVQSGSGDPSPDNERLFVEVKPQRMDVSGKNLIVYPYERPSGSVINGITYTVNADRSITANGTATGNSSYIMMGVPPNFVKLQKGTYTLSGCPAGGGATRYRVGIVTVIGGVYTLIAADYGNGVTFTITDDRAIYQVYCEVRTGYVASNLTFYPQLEIGTVSTPYTPYIGTTIPLPDIGTLWAGDWYDPAAGVAYAEQAFIQKGHTDAWSFSRDDRTNVVEFLVNIGSGINNGASFTTEKCNCFLYGAGNIESFSVAYNSLYVRLLKSRLTGYSAEWSAAEKVAVFKSWIQTNNLTIQAVAKRVIPLTPHFTPITIPTYPKHTVISAEGAQVTARCRVVDR